MNKAITADYTLITKALNGCMLQRLEHKKHAVAVMALGLALSTPLQAATFTVMNNDDSGNGSLRAAIELANTAPGTDDIVFDTTVTGSIFLTSGELVVNDPLIITGPGASTLAIDGNDTSRVLNNLSDLELSGLTITGGGLPNNYGHGGGINNTGNLTITNTTISGNGGYYNIGYGGGIYNTGNLTITNTTISNNLASNGGGGIQTRGNLTVTDSIISGNRSWVGGGGGIVIGEKYGTTATIEINNSTISNNSSYADGGGIIIGRNDGAVTISNSTISNNGTDRIGGGIKIEGPSLVTIDNSSISGNNGNFGGGINNGGSLVVTNSTINSNNGGYTGGGIENWGNLEITNTTISSNNSTFNGGGIENNRGNLTITNSTISGNIASDYGGGIDNGGSLVVINSSISSNDANVGGGIYTSGNAPGTTILNTIIADQNGGTDCDGSITSNGNNLDSDGSCNLTQSTDSPNTNPLLGLLQDNGGPTQTHALLTGSPAIDAGNDAECPVTDQRGVTRPQGEHCDIGAFEYQADTPVALCDLPPVSVAGNCADEVVARSITDIDAYVASDFGRHINANGYLTYKNLRLLGVIGQPGTPLDIISPCRITVNANASLTGSDINLHARMGMVTNWSADIDASGQICLISDKRGMFLNGGNVVNANALAMRGNQKAFVGIQSTLEINGPAELVSTGTGGDSQVKVGNKTTVTADSFTMTADNTAELAFEANVTSTGKLSVSTGSLDSSETLLNARSSLQAGSDIALTSGGKTNISFHTTVSAGNNLEVSAKTTDDCSVASVTSITYDSKSGNCADKLP